MNDGRFIPLIVVLSAVGVMGFSVVAPALPDIATALDVDPSAIGWVQGAVSVPGAVLSILLGWLADRLGRKPVLVVSLLLFGIGGTAAAFSNSFTQLIVLRMVQGAGGGALLGLPIVIIGDLYEGDLRVRVMGWNLTSITAAAAVSPLIGGALAESDPFRPFFVYAVGLLLIPVALRLPPDVARQPALPLRHLRAASAEMRRLGTFGDFLSSIPAGAVTVLVFGGIVFVGTPLHLDAAFGLGPSARGMIISVTSATAAVTSLSLQGLAARLGNGRLFGASVGSATVGLAILALPLGVWAVPIGLMSIGFALGTIFPLLGLVAAGAAPDTYRGTVVGTYTTGVRASQVVGPVVASGLFAVVGGHRMYAIGALITLTVTLSWRKVRASANRRLTASAS